MFSGLIAYLESDTKRSEMIAGAIVLYEASPTPTTALKKESHFPVRKLKI